VGGGLRRSDKVASFNHSNLMKSKLGFSTSSVAYATASPQGEACFVPSDFKITACVFLFMN